MVSEGEIRALEGFWDWVGNRVLRGEELKVEFDCHHVEDDGGINGAVCFYITGIYTALRFVDSTTGLFNVWFLCCELWSYER